MSSLRLAIKLSMAENKDSANPVPKAKSEDDAITEVILGTIISELFLFVSLFLYL